MTAITIILVLLITAVILYKITPALRTKVDDEVLVIRTKAVEVEGEVRDVVKKDIVAIKAVEQKVEDTLHTIEADAKAIIEDVEKLEKDI